MADRDNSSALKDQGCLHFSMEAKPLLTSFRVHALQTIYESAQKELGESLESATVSVYHDHYEPVPPILVLGILADIDGKRFGEVLDVLIDSIATESMLWSEAEKADFNKIIQLDLIPKKI